MEYFFPVHRPDIIPGETCHRDSLALAGYKLHFKMTPIGIAMNHCSHIALFQSATFKIPYQYHGLKFPYHGIFSHIGLPDRIRRDKSGTIPACFNYPYRAYSNDFSFRCVHRTVNDIFCTERRM